MSTEEFRIFLSFIGSIAALGAVTKVLLTWMKRPRSQAALPSELTERLERIERAVDATAIEVERIGEGQRFLTRALADRSVVDSAPASQPPRVITPH